MSWYLGSIYSYIAGMNDVKWMDKMVDEILSLLLEV